MNIFIFVILAHTIEKDGITTKTRGIYTEFQSMAIAFQNFCRYYTNTTHSIEFWESGEDESDNEFYYCATCFSIEEATKKEKELLEERYNEKPRTPKLYLTINGLGETH